MFLIPGFLIAILTFPGVIVHEAAHRFFCDVSGVAVYKVCYFRVGNPSGYVIHGPADRLRAHFLITIGPLIINTILCAVISFTAIIALKLDTADQPIVFVVLLWLGISIGMHAIPSAADVQSFSQAVRAFGRGGLQYGGAKAFEYFIRFANLLRVVWFDLFYAVGTAMALPLIVS
jgi:hypothetical protein